MSASQIICLYNANKMAYNVARRYLRLLGMSEQRIQWYIH